MDKPAVLVEKVKATIKEEGLGQVFRKTTSYLHTEMMKRKMKVSDAYCDVLFINGCDESVPHPIRYRVTHQREQLEACHISTSQVFYVDLELDMVRFARTFVFFRCPYTDMVGQFIELAHKLNRKVLFDIDDLVVDTKYTDTIAYLDDMSKEERAMYDDGVRRMGQTLKLCDAAITTTERLAEELGHYVPEVMINRNVASEDMYQYSMKALQEKEEQGKKDSIDIGYFSGSLTHNEDFEMVLPALRKVMDQYSNVNLHIVGELDVPEELVPYTDRVKAHPFTNWKKLPALIAAVDINIAPLKDSIFNEAKSENKWTEAALVKVPTIASDVGAFQRMIEHEKTGLLCKDEADWERELIRLVEDADLREKLGKAAHAFCIENCLAVNTGVPLCEFIKKYTTSNVAFVLPSMNISGGIMVAMKHAVMLQDAGYDVMLINVDDSIEWCTFDEHQFPVIYQKNMDLRGRMDQVVATMWVTQVFLDAYPNIDKRYYLVQNYEVDFYEAGSPHRAPANKSYMPYTPTKFLTISKWCQEWLKDRYHKDAVYAPNGIDSAKFKPHTRTFDGKIRILIEGDCAVEYKNVDESFRITNQLDPEQFEVWYMSYNATPKDWYRVDKFLHQIPYDEVPDVYSQCDILLKTSLLESFSLPPLEMMASGGLCVVVPNGGNKEYLVDGENCLLYEAGDLEAGIAAIRRICEEPKLRETLYRGGIATAKSRDWATIKDEILAMYTQEA